MGKRKVIVPVNRTMSITDAVAEAYGELEALAEEMREAYDNTPESLQQSGVGEARGEAADNLEGLSEPTVPDWLGEKTFTYSSMPTKKRPSRSSRRDEAVALLDGAVNYLRALEMEGPNAEARDEFADELESLKDDAEAVEFPGMYG